MSAARLMRKCYSSEKPTKTWTEEMWLGFVVSCKRLPFDFVFDDQMMIWFYAKFNYRMFIKTISSVHCLIVAIACASRRPIPWLFTFVIFQLLSALCTSHNNRIKTIIRYARDYFGAPSNLVNISVSVDRVKCSLLRLFIAPPLDASL